MLTWKIVELAEASVLYILDVNLSHLCNARGKQFNYYSGKYYFSFKNSNDKAKNSLKARNV